MNGHLNYLCNWYCAIYLATKRICKFYLARWRYKKRFHKSVSPQIFAERITVCARCELLDPATLFCTICDCDMRIKAEWAEDSCPDNPPRWLDILATKSDDKIV